MKKKIVEVQSCGEIAVGYQISTARYGYNAPCSKVHVLKKAHSDAATGLTFCKKRVARGSYRYPKISLLAPSGIICEACRVEALKVLGDE